MSTLSSRDRKAVTWGGLGVAAILVFNYAVSPLWQRWSDTGSLLESREALVASFRDRLESRDALQTRRDVLALRMGSLRSLHVKEAPKTPEAQPGDNPPTEGQQAGGGAPGAGPKPAGEVVAPEASPKVEAAPGKDGSPPGNEKATPAAAGESAKAENTPGANPQDGNSGNGTPDTKTGAVAKEGPAESNAAATPPAGPVESTPSAPQNDPLVVAKNTPANAGDAAVTDTKKTVEPPAKPAEPTGDAGKTAEMAADGKKAPEAAPGQEGAKSEAAKEGEPDKGKEKETPAREAVPVVEASSLATYLEKNAKAAQVKLQRITPKKNSSGKKRTTHFEPVTLQVSFECQVTQLVKLLHDLETGDQFVRVDQLEITRNVEQGDKLTASMEISSYHLRKEAS
jgi:type II secretory pathway component PulM